MQDDIRPRARLCFSLLPQMRPFMRLLPMPVTLPWLTLGWTWSCAGPRVLTVLTSLSHPSAQSPGRVCVCVTFYKANLDLCSHA